MKITKDHAVSWVRSNSGWQFWDAEKQQYITSQDVVAFIEEVDRKASTLAFALADRIIEASQK